MKTIPLLLIFTLTSCTPTAVQAMDALTINTPTPVRDGGYPTAIPTWTPPLPEYPDTPIPYPPPADTPDPYPIIDPREGLPTDVPAQVASTCKVFTGKSNGLLNLRACASIDCKVITILHEGEQLTILSAGTWLHVLASEGEAGYISSRYCK